MGFTVNCSLDDPVHINLNAKCTITWCILFLPCAFALLAESMQEQDRDRNLSFKSAAVAVSCCCWLLAGGVAVVGCWRLNST